MTKESNYTMLHNTYTSMFSLDTQESVNKKIGQVWGRPTLGLGQGWLVSSPLRSGQPLEDYSEDSWT